MIDRTFLVSSFSPVVLNSVAVFLECISCVPIPQLVPCTTADLFGIQLSQDHHYYGLDFLVPPLALISGWIMRKIEHLADDLIFAGI